VNLIFENIELKPEEKLTDEEKELKKDLQELKKINSDFAKFCDLLKERAIVEQKKLCKFKHKKSLWILKLTDYYFVYRDTCVRKAEQALRVSMDWKVGYYCRKCLWIQWGNIWRKKWFCFYAITYFFYMIFDA